jgi:urease subunit alpha
MKAERGSLAEDAGSGNDNTRIKRYVAKHTLNAARIFGLDHELGSLEPGKLADIVLWEPKFFGIKPEVVFKGGFPAWSVMGESNASLMTCEPLVYRPQWGAFGGAAPATSVTFMSQAAIDEGIPDRLGLRARCVAPRGTRSLTKRDLLWNDALPEITVDPETYRVEVDGELCTCEPLSRVPLGPLYVLK